MQIHAMATMAATQPLRTWEFPAPALGPFDALLQVKACGLCHSDIHMIDDDWKMSSFPLVPGHEAIGEVLEKGSQVAHLAIGDRVGVGWQRAACLQCEDCLSGNENLCTESQGTITHGPGGFASHLLIDSRFCFEIPDGITTETAGPLLCGGITVYSALRSAGMSSGQEIGVIGVGGLGHLAVQFASRLGNRVTVFTTSTDKAEFATRLGAHSAVIVKTGPPEALPRPLDILISTVPVPQDWNAYLGLLGTDGTLTFVGVPGGVPISIDFMRLLVRRRRVMASPIGSRARIMDMLRVADQFGVAPIVETFPLAEVNTAIQKVRDNTIRYRAVLKP